MERAQLNLVNKASSSKKKRKSRTAFTNHQVRDIRTTNIRIVFGYRAAPLLKKQTNYKLNTKLQFFSYFHNSFS